PLGLVWSAAAVGVAFGSYAIAGVLVVSRSGLSVSRLALGFIQPLAACGAMVLAVLALRPVLRAAVPVWGQLGIEIAGGGFVYVNVALVVCRAAARDLIALARDMLRRSYARRE